MFRYIDKGYIQLKLEYIYANYSFLVCFIDKFFCFVLQVKFKILGSSGHYCKNSAEIGQVLMSLRVCIKTSLLCRLQVQILPNATPPRGKIHPFSKLAVTFEPIRRAMRIPMRIVEPMP